MADKIYNETIVNIDHPETTPPIFMYTWKGVFTHLMKKHVSFNQIIFSGMLLFLPMRSLFQILRMRKLNSIRKYLWSKTSDKITCITTVFVVMNARLCGINFQ